LYQQCGIAFIVLLFYFVRLYQFDADRELMNTASIPRNSGGIVSGLITTLFISFIYFLVQKEPSSERLPIVGNPELFNKSSASPIKRAANLV
jgi:hypothetical protein